MTSPPNKKAGLDAEQLFSLQICSPLIGRKALHKYRPPPQPAALQPELAKPVILAPRVILEKIPMNLTITVPDEDVAALKAKAAALGVSAEQYALQVLEQDLAPDWLRRSWATAQESGLDQLSMEEIDAEIAAARKATREARPQPDV